MRKKYILYSLNPLLAGLLLIGSLGGIYVRHDRPFTSNETKVVLPMYPEDEKHDFGGEAYFQRNPDPFTSGLVGTKTVKTKLLKEEEMKPYELVYQDDQFIFQPAELVKNSNILSLPENQDRVAENDDRLILFTLNEDGHDQLYYFTVGFDFEDLDCPVWERLREKKNSYYRVLMDGERIIFVPLPPEGIRRSRIKASDLFALVKFDIVPLRKRANGSSPKVEEDENKNEDKITFLLIGGDEIKNRQKKKRKKRKTSYSQPSIQYYPPGSTLPSLEPPYYEDLDEDYYEYYDEDENEVGHTVPEEVEPTKQSVSKSEHTTKQPDPNQTPEFTLNWYESWLKEQEQSNPPAPEHQP